MTPKYKIGDKVDVRMSAVNQAYEPRTVRTLFKGNKKPHGEIIDLYIYRVNQGKSIPKYGVQILNQSEPVWLSEDQLEPRVELTPETDAVFRDIIRDV